MKNIITLIITCFSCIFCSTQMKINKSNDVDILVKTPVNLTTEIPVTYTIKNNSEKTYIIDPYGFVGDSYWMLNNKKIEPIEFSRGYYSRENIDCTSDLIILNPKQKIDTVLSLNYAERGRYDFSNSGNYIWNVQSNHNKQNGMPSSCKQYIDELELKGYRFLNDSIVAKIPFYK